MKTTLSNKLRYFISAIFALLFSSSLMAQPTGPPPLPPTGGTPPCWPPPCIPIDNGIIFLVLAAFVFGTVLLYKAGFKLEFKN